MKNTVMQEKENVIKKKKKGAVHPVDGGADSPQNIHESKDAVGG